MRVSEHPLIWCLVFFLAGFSLSCASPLVLSNLAPFPVVKLNVEPYTQEPEKCGTSALAAVMDYLGKEADPEEMAQRLYLTGVRGTLTMDLFLEARRNGLDVTQGEGNFAGVRRDLASGYPLVLLVRYPAPKGDIGHYVVVNGFTDQPTGYFLLWGNGVESWMKESNLRKMWMRSGWWHLSFSGKSA